MTRILQPFSERKTREFMSRPISYIHNRFSGQIFPRCRPALDVALRSYYGANILGMIDDLHFAKFLTVCRHPTQQVMAIFTATLYPTTFLMIQVESSHPIHNHEGRRQGGHQQPEGRGGHHKIIGIGTRRSIVSVTRVHIRSLLVINSAREKTHTSAETFTHPIQLQMLCILYILHFCISQSFTRFPHDLLCTCLTSFALDGSNLFHIIAHA